MKISTPNEIFSKKKSSGKQNEFYEFMSSKSELLIVSLITMCKPFAGSPTYLQFITFIWLRTILPYDYSIIFAWVEY